MGADVAATGTPSPAELRWPELAAPPRQEGRYVDFPLVQPTDPLRLAAKRLVGYALLAWHPAEATELDAGGGPDELQRKHKIMLCALMHRAERQGKLEEFIHRQQRRFWTSDAIADFHAVSEKYFEDYFLGEHVQTLLELERLLAERPYAGLCEIGCGHGRVSYYLSQRLAARIDRFVALDLSREQIRRNQVRYQGANVEWVAGEAEAWITANAGPGWVFLTHNGVLEYFRRDDLRRLFAFIAQRCSPAIVSFSEPVGVDHDLANELGSPPYGYEKSFSHNYPHLLREAGFEIAYQSEFRSGSHRLLRLVARA
jgi:hypothetical protein